MKVTPYKNVNKFLEDFLFQVKKILGDKLVGLYLYGSLTWEDFDIDISDIDLLAVLSVDLNENEALALEK
ncbi:MAG: adenylyltransferase, partial [Patescibacteria group bacterium]|nr:adenylyltransferase [Patescibacteria group bacterium]